MFIDCRNFPSDTNCSITICGEPDELEEAAVEHAICVHGERDTADLRHAIRRAMRDENAFRHSGYAPDMPPGSEPELDGVRDGVQGGSAAR
jgi:hypothetical protein